MRIGLTGIFVDDQDHAERFYTEILGLKIKTNAPYGPTERWLTIVSPRRPGRGRTGAAPDQRPSAGVPTGQRAIGRPVISLRTEDCRREAERLEANGVVFVKEPARLAYGGMDAVFDDTCGNVINVHQD
jgi:catechol 2,3-dioxygenase-like lactoylglutathione lyase family enzyme